MKSQQLGYRIHIFQFIHEQNIYMDFMNGDGGGRSDYIVICQRTGKETKSSVERAENPDLESRQLEKWMTVGCCVMVWENERYMLKVCITEPPPFDLLVALHMRFNSPFPIPPIIDCRLLVRLCHSYTVSLLPQYPIFCPARCWNESGGSSGSRTETETGLRVIHSPVFIHKIGFFEWKSLLHSHFRSKNRILCLKHG